MSAFGDAFLAAWCAPDPFACWKPDSLRRPRKPQQPAYPRPERPRAKPIRFAMGLDGAALDIVWAAERDRNREEAMIWEAGRIHGPEGDRATSLTIECALCALEDGAPYSWWEPEWTYEDGAAAIRAVDAREKHDWDDERRCHAENLAIDAAPETDPEWAAYDAAMVQYQVAMAEWQAKAIENGRKVSGYASEAEHRKAVRSPFGEVIRLIEATASRARNQ